MDIEHKKLLIKISKQTLAGLSPDTNLYEGFAYQVEKLESELAEYLATQPKKKAKAKKKKNG